jgi:pimeloyl-ACP methyl ester carboxylesterase
MPIADIRGIRIAWEEQGSGPTLLLIMGLGAPRGLWPDPFCDRLAERGFRVVRFDNRDVGESTWFDDAPADVVRSAGRRILRRPVQAAYTLQDMADDAVGLMDHLGIGAAHVVGASMGGMIGQVLACEHADRVLSLTSIMSSTGRFRHFLGNPSAVWKATRPPPVDPAELIDHNVEVLRAIWGDGFPFNEEGLRDQMSRMRGGSNPSGVTRHVAAIVASGDRTARLSTVRAPTLVVHGTADPLIPLAAGKATATAIPDAELLVIEGMGHGLPQGAWDRIVDGIEVVARRGVAAPA